MEIAINKLQQWLADEREIADQMAHDCASAKTVEKMVSTQNTYLVQAARTDAIEQAVQLLKEVAEKETV